MTRASFPPPPDADEAMRIAEHIHTMAERLIDDPPTATRMFEEWIISQPRHIASLRLHYLAVTAPLIAAAIMRKGHAPTAEGLFALYTTPEAAPNPARDAAARSLVRFLNDDVATAHDIIDAAFTAGGDAARLDVGIEALKLLAAVLEGGAS